MAIKVGDLVYRAGRARSGLIDPAFVFLLKDERTLEKIDGTTYDLATHFAGMDNHDLVSLNEAKRLATKYWNDQKRLIQKKIIDIDEKIIEIGKVRKLNFYSTLPVKKRKQNNTLFSPGTIVVRRSDLPSEVFKWADRHIGYARNYEILAHESPTSTRILLKPVDGTTQMWDDAMSFVRIRDIEKLASMARRERLSAIRDGIEELQAEKKRLLEHGKNEPFI